MNNNIILCVDDETMVLKSLKEQIKMIINNPLKEMLPIFKNNKYEIVLEENSSESLAVFNDKSYKIPLVIADFIMPDIKGDKLLELIHKVSPHTVKVMLTGQATIEGVVNAINTANLYKFLKKPWEFEDLKKVIYKSIILYESKINLDKENQSLEEKHLILKAELEKLIIEYQSLTSSIPENKYIKINDISNIDLIIESLKNIKNKIHLVCKDLQALKTDSEKLLENNSKLQSQIINDIENIFNYLHVKF